MSTDFFGTKVSADKPTPYVPRPNSDNGTETLVLLNATIPASCKLAKGTRISLIVKTEICDSVALATLIVAQQDNAKMDIALDSYAEFSVMGPKGAEIHVTGHYLPKPPAEEDDEEGDLKQAFAGLLGAPSGYNGEDDEDDESDEDYEEDDDDEAPAAQGKRKKATVEITEVKEEKAPKKSGSVQEADGSSGDDAEDDGKPEAASAGKRALQPKQGNGDSDDDDDEDDEDDDDDGDDDDDEEEDGDSDEEMESDDDEEEAPAAAKENGKPAQQAVAKDGKRASAEPSTQPAQKRMKHTKFANGFEVQQVRESSNPNAPQAQLGKSIVVKYRGTLPNGKVFDETTGNKTFTFRLGVGEVIKGWDKGLAGMRVGDKRKLVVPPSMGYGSTGVANVIPKNSILHFEVELLRVKDGKR